MSLMYLPCEKFTPTFREKNAFCAKKGPKYRAKMFVNGSRLQNSSIRHHPRGDLPHFGIEKIVDPIFSHGHRHIDTLSIG